MKNQGWTSLEHRQVYSNKKLSLWEDQVLLPDGKQTSYDYVERANSVLIIARDEHDALYLVRQYRYPVAQYSWEFPAGNMEKDEEPETAARRELQQEISHTARNLQLLGKISTNASLTNQRCYVFLASGLSPASQKRDATESDMEVKTFSLSEIEEMVRTGQIHETSSIAALSLLQLWK